MTADTYTSNIGIIQQGTGNNNNNWGVLLDNGLQVVDDAIAGVLTSTVTGGTLDLSGSAPPAGPSQVRHSALLFGGALTSNQIVKVPNLTKWWLVNNATSGAFTLKLQTPSGAVSAAIPQNGQYQLVQCDGGNNIVVWPFNTKQIQMPDGSAAAPAYSDINETSSGWYRNGTQDWRLAVNGLDVLQATGAGAGTASVVNVLSPNVLQIAGGQVIPPGAEQAYAGIELPAGGWLWEDGTAYSRTTNANLFAALTKTCNGSTHSSTTIDTLTADLRHKGLDGAFVEGTGIPTGTTIVAGSISAGGFTLSQAATSTGNAVALRILPFGQGDASTTFNVPDRRGRALFGRDDMNGTPANRITPAGSGIQGTTLNSAAGAENHTLTTANIPTHTHGYSGTTSNDSPDHTHTTGAVGSGQTNIGAGNGSPVTFVIGTSSTTTSGASTRHTHTFSGTTDIGSGSGTAFSIMPPMGVTNWIIKT